MFKYTSIQDMNKLNNIYKLIAKYGGTTGAGTFDQTLILTLGKYGEFDRDKKK